jgi:undecaprenyl-diphosphatase
MRVLPTQSRFPAHLRSQPPELALLAALLAFATASFDFLKLLEEMGEGETQWADRAILLALRTAGDPADPVGPVWLESVCRDLTSLGSPAVLSLLTLGVLGYLAIDGRRGAALLVAVAVVGGGLLSVLLKLGFARPRPELVAHLVREESFSFPSGHATMATATYLTLGVLLAREAPRPRVKFYIVAAALAVAVLVGLTRIYLGVHWPTDVLGGWCLGAAWALGCWVLANLILRERTP